MDTLTPNLHSNIDPAMNTGTPKTLLTTDPAMRSGTPNQLTTIDPLFDMDIDLAALGLELNDEVNSHKGNGEGLPPPRKKKRRTGRRQRKGDPGRVNLDLPITIPGPSLQTLRLPSLISLPPPSLQTLRIPSLLNFPPPSLPSLRLPAPKLERVPSSLITNPGNGSLQPTVSGGPGDITNPDIVLINAYMEMDEMAEKINAPKAAVDRACDLFKEVHDGERFKVRRKTAIASACLYVACRLEKMNLQLREIHNISKVHKKRVDICIKDILTMYNISFAKINTEPFMRHYCSYLGLPKPVAHTANKIFFKSINLGIVIGCEHRTIIAAALFMACQASPPEHKRSLEEIAAASGLAVADIQRSYTSMYPCAAKLFPEDFEFHTPVEALPPVFFVDGGEASENAVVKSEP